LNKNINILVTDDLLTMRSLIIKSLNMLGFDNTLEAEDGKIALEVLLTENVELLITDWSMLNMDGLELIKQVRSNTKIKDLKILMISTKDSKQDIAEAIAAGANGYITKPFNLKTLEDNLNNIL
jgi:two-component system chemotaxis response regulator CheY